jgi:hypothetical protein
MSGKFILTKSSLVKANNVNKANKKDQKYSAQAS